MKNTKKIIIHYSVFLIILIMLFGIFGMAVDVHAGDPLGDCTTETLTDGLYRHFTITKIECESLSTHISWTQTGATTPTQGGDPNATTLTPAGDSSTGSAGNSTSSSSTVTPAPFTGGLVTCDNSAGKLCDFNAFTALINRVIKFILFDMVIPISAIMFAYAGFLMVTAGGEAAGARTKAKSIFYNAVFGLIIAVAAFLIIKTILSILGYEGSWIGF